MEPTPTYEQAAARLEQIVAQLEQGRMDIDQLATHIKEAQRLITFCRTKLLAVEKEIKEIMPDDGTL